VSVRRTLRRQRGAGIMETMIGILIGLLVVLVVYNLLAVAEGYRRSTTGAADAQITGLLSQFAAGRDAANGGNGISSALPELINCTKNEAGAASSILRPIPLIVQDGGADNVSDSFISWHAGSPHVVWPVDVRSLDAAPAPTVLAGDPITVQSPNGFSTPGGASLPTVAAPYWIVIMDPSGGAKCKLLQVTAATAPDVTGVVALTQGANPTTIPYSSQDPHARVLNLGPVANTTRVRYDVASDQLRTTDCMDRDWACTGGVPNPIAQNVVLMKVQYGIDTSVPPDFVVDCWTSAVDAACGGDWTFAHLTESDVAVFPAAAAQQAINRILAVRVAVVVRSDEPDFKDATLTSGARAATVLFNCAANDATCQGRIVVPAGAAATQGSSACAPAIICDYWRYRTYETVIPLRNAIYAATHP
jgi:type IV pilus assembly protein PilW